MKNLLLLILVIISGALFAQEEISMTTAYVSYQDSLFILQTTTITNEGLEGVNDTIIDYTGPALDSAGLRTVLYNAALNEINETVARFRRAFQYRKINAVSGDYSDLLSGIDGDLDSFMVATYANQLKGNWKYTDSAGVVRTFALIDHPSRADRLRMDEDGGADENLNVTVDGRWQITIRIDNENVTFVWSGEDRTRPKFYLERFWLPRSALPGEVNNARWVKTQ